MTQAQPQRRLRLADRGPHHRTGDIDEENDILAGGHTRTPTQVRHDGERQHARLADGLRPMEGDRGEGTITEPAGDEYHVAIERYLCAREGDAQPLPLLGSDSQRMGGAFDPDCTV